MLLNDSQYIGTTNNVVDPVPVVVLKTTFVNTSGWKSYILLTFYIRSDNGRYQSIGKARDPTDHQKACVYMNNACIKDIQIANVKASISLSVFTAERQLGPAIDRGVVYLLTITYSPRKLRQEGFVSSFTGDPHPKATQIQNFITSPSSTTIRIVLNANAGGGILNEVDIFRDQLKTNVVDYAKYYPKHSGKHFIQIGDYSDFIERSIINVSVAFSFDTFSEYTIMYDFDVIIEHEIVTNVVVNIVANIFQLRVMNVSDSNNEYYIEFLQCFDLPDVKLNTKNKLKIHFDLKHVVKATE